MAADVRPGAACPKCGGEWIPERISLADFAYREAHRELHAVVETEPTAMFMKSTVASGPMPPMIPAVLFRRSWFTRVS